MIPTRQCPRDRENVALPDRWPPDGGPFPAPINLQKHARIALSFLPKPCSVSTRVDRFRVREEGAPNGAKRPQRGRRHATPGGQAVADTLRRSLWRDDRRQQQNVA